MSKLIGTTCERAHSCAGYINYLVLMQELIVHLTYTARIKCLDGSFRHLAASSTPYESLAKRNERWQNDPADALRNPRGAKLVWGRINHDGERREGTVASWTTNNLGRKWVNPGFHAWIPNQCSRVDAWRMKQLRIPQCIGNLHNLVRRNISLWQRSKLWNTPKAQKHLLREGQERNHRRS